MSARVLSVFGTRPEAIKMAPVIELLERQEGLESRVCVTAQHREMLDSVLDVFGIVPDHDLELMSPGQDLCTLTSRALLGVRDVIREEQPRLVLVHGDTTTTLAAALAAFHEGVPVGHVEAGLRSGDLQRPFPEEMNRAVVDRMASLHFAPTERAREVLLAESISADSIHLTGNTVIDALQQVRDRVAERPIESWRDAFGRELCDEIAGGGRRLILITGHRRESFGSGFRDLCRGIARAAMAHPEWTFVYPVHLNPNVRMPVRAALGHLPNVHLLEPLAYPAFVWLMSRAELILTDSGGIQEEAPALGVPVLVLRDVTDRPEAVEAGTALMVGTDPQRIFSGLRRVLLHPGIRAAMSRAVNPYGDGRAARRIVDAIGRHLEVGAAPELVGVA